MVVRKSVVYVSWSSRVNFRHLPPKRQDGRRLRPLESPPPSSPRHSKLLANLERVPADFTPRARRVSCPGTRSRCVRPKRRIGVELLLMTRRHASPSRLERARERKRLIEAPPIDVVRGSWFEWSSTSGESCRGLEEGRRVLGLAKGEGVGALKLTFLVAKVL
jgi:hypothetical protein